jgi:DNA-directed RNA polymerase specialized sigma24 family protein
VIVAAVKAAGRAALARDKARRRQRVADRRKHHHIEDDQQAAATERQTLALARRASTNLETLARLKEHYDDGPSVLALAVAGARSQGYSDAEIGAALHCTRAAVGQRFGRKGDLYTGMAGTGPGYTSGGCPGDAA